MLNHTRYLRSKRGANCPRASSLGFSGGDLLFQFPFSSKIPEYFLHIIEAPQHFAKSLSSPWLVPLALYGVLVVGLLCLFQKLDLTDPALVKAFAYAIETTQIYFTPGIICLA